MPELKLERFRRFPRTDLSDPIVLVVPDGMSESPAVQDLRGLLASEGGRSPDLMSQKDVTEAQFRDAHVFAFGNLSNNAALRRLYTARCCFADTFFPGGDGYFIRSVSDPFGYGKNCLTVGASTDEGLAGALPVLRDLVHGTGGAVGRLHAARFDHELPPPPDASELESMVRADLDLWGSGWAASPFRGGKLQSYLWHFYLTDHPVWGRAIPEIFSGSIEPWRAERRDYPERYHCLFHLHSFFHLWDLVEDSPLYTESDRRDVVTMFGEVLRHLSGLFYVKEEVNPPGEIRQNHTTFIALNLAVGRDYMARCYGVREFDAAAIAAERIFEGQAGCYKPNDDGGVGYTWHVPQETLSYYLYRNDERYLRCVADLCKLAVVTTDNMRSEGNYGDTAGYPAFEGRGWEGRLWPLMVSTWHSGDPEHLWALNWLGEGKRPPLARVLSGLYAAVGFNGTGFTLPGREAREPAGLLGVCSMSLPEPVLDWVRAHHPETHHPDPKKSYFDKLSLRRSFDSQDEYLLLEGLGTTCHGHEDTNAIVRLTWNNRAWLGDGDYIRAAPHYHSSVVVNRDGLGVLDSPGDGVVIPPLASLNHTEDGPEFGLVQSEASGYNGVDWLRNLFWRKGRYVVVLDLLRCAEDGEYRCRCLWRVVGEAALEGAEVCIEQEGERFYLRNADGAAQEVVVDPHEKSRWQAYPYADDRLRVVHQRSGRSMRQGEVLGFQNLLTPFEEVRIERLGDRMVKVTDGPEVSILGVGSNTLGGVGVAGTLFRISLVGDRISFQGVDRLDGVVSGEVDAGVAARLRDAVRGAAPVPATQRVPRSGWPEGGLRERWSLTVGDGEICDADVAGDGILVGTEDGRVARVAVPDGSVSWSVQVGEASAPTQVLLDGLGEEGRPEAVVGTVDSQVILLDGRDGSEQWRRPLRNMFGRGGRVTALAAADLEGDGEVSVLAGTAGWFVNAFFADGTPKWAEWFRYHAITGMRVADADGDGRAEVMVGTEYSTPLTVHNFDGSFRWSTFEEVGSEGNATTPRRGIQLNRMLLRDVDGDGVQEIVYGTGDGWIYAVSPKDGAERWRANLSGEVSGLDSMPGGIVAANEYGRLYGFSDSGKLLWYVQAANWIHDLVQVGGRILVAADGGQVLCYDPDGSCTGSLKLAAEVRKLRACEGGAVCTLAGGRLSFVEP